MGTQSALFDGDVFAGYDWIGVWFSGIVVEECAISIWPWYGPQCIGWRCSFLLMGLFDCRTVKYSGFLEWSRFHSNPVIGRDGRQNANKFAMGPVIHSEGLVVSWRTIGRFSILPNIILFYYFWFIHLIHSYYFCFIHILGFDVLVDGLELVLFPTARPILALGYSSMFFVYFKGAMIRS